MGWYYSFRPYVSVAKRQQNAAREMAKLAKKGRTISPVKIDGLKIAKTFWGKAWCDNLESYGDYANRIPRGRTYVRNGSVVDLQIEPGRVTAVVSGSELYDVKITIKPLVKDTWHGLKKECGGQIGSLVELLQGRLSQGVMELVTRRQSGLFPSPGEIDMDCSCPDGAYMCKHIAAVMYGIGARLDQQPELLFKLRKVDHLELIAEAGAPTLPADSGAAAIAEADLADVFGIELDLPAGKADASIALPKPSASARKRKAPVTAHQASRPRKAKATLSAPAASVPASKPSARVAKMVPKPRRLKPVKPPAATDIEAAATAVVKAPKARKRAKSMA